MQKLLSTLGRNKAASGAALQQKLMIGAIVIALVPSIGVLVWGIAKAIKSPELETSDWTNHPTASTTPIAPAPIPPDDQQ